MMITISGLVTAQIVIHIHLAHVILFGLIEVRKKIKKSRLAALQPKN